MSNPANEPSVERPLASSDFLPVPERAEITPQTSIGKFKIPTEALRAYTMVFALIAIWIFFHYSTGRIFLDPRNFSNLMRQTAVTGVLAVGMLMVIITGQVIRAVAENVIMMQGWTDGPTISNGGKRWDATKLGQQLATDFFKTRAPGLRY